MASALLYLTYLAVLLLVGIICSVIANKAKISNVLLLIIVGIGMSSVPYNGQPLIQFSQLFLTSIAVLALVMIVFDSSSRFKIKEFDSMSFMALKLTAYFLAFNLIFLTLFTHLMFSVKSVFLSLIFSALMSDTDPGTVLSILNHQKNKVTEFLKVESLINTPFIVLLPFIFLNLMESISDEPFSRIIEQILPFLQQIITGIGSGILVGIVVFKVMRKFYSESISPLAMITSALLTYIIAENLKGNGVLAVTTLGLFFSSISIKEKATLSEFSFIFSNSLEILVFILIGFTIKIPFTADFIFKSLLLFGIYLLIRLASVSVAFSNKSNEFDFREKIFMSLNVSKGIAVAVVAFILSTLQIEGMQAILNLTLAFLLYSIILSTITLKFSGYFLKKEFKNAPA